MSQVETTDAEIEELRALQQEIAGAVTSAWEPRCIANAFASQGLGDVVMTMQNWIDLERVKSPILVGLPLETDDDLRKAAEIFGIPIDGDTDEVAHIAMAMERAAREAFAMSLKMRQPNAVEMSGGDGFGTWLPTMAFLTEGRMSWAEAAAFDVRRAFAVMAATRRNQGWDVAGVPYALRGPRGEEDGNG